MIWGWVGVRVSPINKQKWKPKMKMAPDHHPFFMQDTHIGSREVDRGCSRVGNKTALAEVVFPPFFPFAVHSTITRTCTWPWYSRDQALYYVAGVDAQLSHLLTPKHVGYFLESNLYPTTTSLMLVRQVLCH